MRLIDAKEIERQARMALKESNPVLMGQILRYIRKQPTIDAVEVVRGWWDDSGRYQFPNGRKAIRCNICGCALSESEYSLFNWNYCPVCGAKMDGERKDE